MSALKKGLVWFTAVVFFLLAAAVFAATTIIDWNQYRSTLADLTSDRLGVRVELARELRLSLLPRPSVIAEGVRLSPLENLNGATIATAERIDMRLGLVAALSGNLQLQSLTLDGLATTILQTEEGWRLEGWPVQPDDGSGAGQSSGRDISLDRLTVTAGTISVKTLKSTIYELKNLNLDLAGSLPDGPLEWVGSVSLDNQNFDTTGKLTPTRSGDVAAKLNIRAADADLDLSGRISDGRSVVGRAVFEAKSLSKLVKVASILNPGEPLGLPDLPLGLDIQVDHSGGLTKLVSRRFTVDESVGQLDLTVASNGPTPSVTGSVSLGLVSFDPWLTVINQPSTVETSANAGSSIALNGAIDLSVESVSMRGSVIQNVEATIGLSNGEVSPQRVQALLPGASRFQYLAANENGGTISFETSRLPQVLEWAGVSLPPEIPAGRLMTARFSTELAMDETEWRIDGLSGRFDTSKLEGRASGQLSPLSLSDINIVIDELNLDAYWPNNSFSSSGSNTPLDVTFDLSVADMRFRGENFSNVKLEGAVKADQVSLNTISLNHGGGSAQGTGQYNSQSGEEAMDASMDFVDWHFPLVKAFGGDAEYLSLLETAPYSGSIRLNGPLTALQTSAKIENDQRNVSLVGQLAKADIWTARLQGSYNDNSTSQLLSMMAPQFAAANAAPEPRTDLAVVLDGPINQMNYRTSGSFLNGQLDLNGQNTQNEVTANISFVAEPSQTAAIDGLIGEYAALLPKNVGRQVRADVTYGDGVLIVQNMNLRFGNEVLAGNFNYGFGKQNLPATIDGSLSIERVNFDRVMDYYGAQSTSSTDAADSGSNLRPSGQLQLSLLDSRMQGQRLNTSQATLDFKEDGSVALDFGANALMNGAPLTAKIEKSGSSQIKSQIVADAFDMGEYAKVLGVSDRLISGTAKITTDMTATGDTGDALLNSLTGNLEISGTSGSLFFLAAQDIIAAVNSASNPTSFLTSIGGLLRGGQTDFANLDGLVRIDGGVALVDRLNVGGSWGELSLDGQVNMPADLLSLKGNLTLSNPVGAPPIPVTYEGSLSSPSTRWASRAIERFALAGIERRIRNQIFGEMENAEREGQSQQLSPGTAILGTAFGFLDKLRKKQQEKKQAKEQAKSETSAQEPETQTP